jgi:Polyketide cyclase / dehydrase and lipid transport
VKRERFVIEDSRRAPSSPETILNRIASPVTWPDWQSEILSVEGPERVREGDVVHGDAKLLGFQVEGHSSILEVTPDSLFEDVIVGVRMRIRYEVVPDGDGAVVTHRLESDLPRGVAGRVLAVLLKWRLRKMQSMLLDDLVRGAGTGNSKG